MTGNILLNSFFEKSLDPVFLVKKNTHLVSTLTSRPETLFWVRIHGIDHKNRLLHQLRWSVNIFPRFLGPDFGSKQREYAFNSMSASDGRRRQSMPAECQVLSTGLGAKGSAANNAHRNSADETNGNVINLNVCSNKHYQACENNITYIRMS